MSPNHCFGWMLFYLTEKEQVKMTITKLTKNNVGFDHGFNGREKNTVTIVFPHETTSTFFLALTMQQIALQVPEKYSKSPLNLVLNCDSLLQPLLYLDD